MRHLIWIWFLGRVMVTAADAQPLLKADGRITDSAGVPVAGATVCLRSPRDSTCSVSREDGLFSVSGSFMGTYTLLVEAQGYVTLRRRIPLNKAPVHLGMLALRKSYKTLDPFLVSQVRPVTVREDTVEYHAGAFTVSTGALAEDLLKRLPGIEVDMDGNVSVQGKKIGKVMVDGHEFYGGDVLSATRNLPANIIQSIQVIDDYGDRAKLTGVKSGDPAKILNIVLKPEKRNGVLGHAQAGAGGSGKYLADGMGSRFDGDNQQSVNAGSANNNPAGRDIKSQSALHYADRLPGAWSGSATANFSKETAATNASYTENDYSGGTTVNTVQNGSSTRDASGGGGSATILYKPGNQYSLRATPAVIVRQGSQQGLSDAVVVLGDSGFTRRTRTSTQNNSNFDSRTASVGLYGEHGAPSARGRWDIKVNIEYISSTANSLSLVRNAGDTGSTHVDSLTRNQSASSAANWKTSAATDYFAPLARSITLETGLKAYVATGWVNRQVSSTDSIMNQPGSLASRFTTSIVTVAMHNGLLLHTGRSNMNLALDLQPSSLHGRLAGKNGAVDAHYVDILPLVEWRWQASKTSKLSARYNGSTALPDPQQLAPSTDLTNPQYPVTGNPSLKESYTQSFNIGFEHSQLKGFRYFGYEAAAGYSATANAIVPSVVNNRDSSPVIQYLGYANARGMSNGYVTFHITSPGLWKNKFRSGLSIALNTSRVPTVTDGLFSANKSLSFAAKIQAGIYIPDVIEAGSFFNYTRTLSTSAGTGAVASASGAFTLQAKNYLWKRWLISYDFSRQFAIESGRVVNSATTLNAAARWECGRQRNIAITFLVNNLLDNTSNIASSVTPTSNRVTVTNYTGRYGILSLSLRLQRFNGGEKIPQ